MELGKSKVDFDYITLSIKKDIIPVFQKSGHLKQITDLAKKFGF